MSMLYHLREILVRLGMLVVSEQVAIGNAANAFDETDRLIDERTASLMAATCKALVDTAAAIKGR